MAIIRTTSELNHSVNYLATLALFACVSCLILMFKLGGFRASINFYGRKKKNEDNDESASMAGAYRINRSEFFENGRVSAPRNNTTIPMVQVPPSAQSNTPLRPTKSTSDLTAKNNPPTNLSKSEHDVSHLQDPRGPNAHNNRNTAMVNQKNNKEQMKLEKKRLAEQRATERNAAKERERAEKLAKKRQKEAAREQARVQKENKKKPAPQPPAATPLKNPISSEANRHPTSNRSPNQVPRIEPTTQPETPNNNNLTAQAPYSSNTLQSSISRSSGPPPYSEITTNQEADNNVIFSKPIEEPTNSWDLISQHRQQMSKPTTRAPTKGPKKNMVMDLQYKLGDENS